MFAEGQGCTGLKPFQLMNMRKLFVVVFFAALMVWTPSRLYADERSVDELSPRERVFVGGFVGLQFGTFTSIGVHLHAGYRITNRFSAGIGGVYQYTHDSWGVDNYSSHTYGANVFARLRTVSNLFLHGEYERLWLESRRPLPTGVVGEEDRPSIREDNFLLGAGYALHLSHRARLNLLLLYNFNENSQAYMDNPFFRVGVDVSL